MITKIILFFKKHYPAVVFAVVVGCLSVAPHFLAKQALGSDYAGIPFMYTDDEDLYLGQIQEVLDGHGWLASPYLYEYKNDTSLVFPIGVWLYALPTIIFKISPVTVLVASKFLIPALLFFLIYLLVGHLITEDRNCGRWHAVATGLLVTLGYDFVDYKYVWSILIGDFQKINLLVWTRPINPILGAVLLVSLLLLLWAMFNRRLQYGYIFSGALIGLMTGYFFSWGTALAIVGILVVISIAKKEYKLSRDLFFSVVIGFLVALPYWYNSIVTLSNPNGSEFALRNGMFFTHAPIVNKVILATTLFFALMMLIQYYQERTLNNLVNSRWWLFCLALLSAGWLVFNQQIVTGRTIWPHHFVQYTIPLCMVVAMVLIYKLIKPQFFKLWLVLVVGMILSTVYFGFVSAGSYVYELKNFTARQRYQPLFSWLNQNNSGNCVVLESELDNQELNRLITAFTKCDLYTTVWVFAGITPERIEHNYFILLRLQGVDDSNVQQYLKEHPWEIRANFYENWDQLFGKDTETWITSRVKDLTDDYKEFLSKDFLAGLKEYKLNYVVADGTVSQLDLYDKYFGERVWQQAQLVVYKLK